MYITLITMALLCFSKALLIQGGVASRLKRDTDTSHVEALYSRYKTISHGEATYYGKYPGGGACSLDPLSPLANQPGWIRVAAGREEFQNSLGCGMCVEIKGTGQGKGSDPVTGTMKGVVHDLCGGCKQGDLDLYIPGDGRWDITIQAIDCPTLPGSDGNIMMRFTGSNPWYIKLQARNTKIPVAGIEVLKNNKYSCLRRVNDNYFVGDKLGKVDFPMQVRLTAVNGEQRETIIPNLKNDADTTTDIQFTSHETGGGPSTILCMGQGNKSPYPSGGLDPSSSGTSSSKPSIGGARPTTAAPPVSPAPNTPSPGNVNFCKNRKGGTYVDPDDCRGFIICNIGNTHRQKCGDGLLFNPVGMNCDLPSRVDCGSRPLDLPTKNTTFSDQVKPENGINEISNGQQMDEIKEIENRRLDNQEMHQQETNHNELSTQYFPDKKLTEMAKQELVYNSKNIKNTSMSERASHSSKELEDKETNNSTSNIHVHFHFGGAKTNDKTQDIPSTDKTSHPSESMVHVTINDDRSIGASSSSSQSADDAYKSKPSFEIVVNNEGHPAKVNGDERKNANHIARQDSHGKSGGIIESQGRIGDDHNSKSNFELMTRKNKEHVQIDRHEVHEDVGHLVLSKENDQKNRTTDNNLHKNTNMKDNNGSTQAKESHEEKKLQNPGVTSVPVKELSSINSANATNANRTESFTNSRPLKEIKEKSQTFSQMNVPSKENESIKVIGVNTAVSELQRPLQTRQEQMVAKAEPLPVMAKALIHSDKSLSDDRPSHLIFNHPLEALTAYNNHQHLLMNEKNKEQTGEKEIEDVKKNGQKEGEISGGGKTQENLGNDNATNQRDDSQEKQKQPSLKILVHSEEKNSKDETGGTPSRSESKEDKNRTTQRNDDQKQPELDIHKPGEDRNKNDQMKEESSQSGKLKESSEDENATQKNDRKQQKEPMLDIVVHGGSDGTTELRLRNNNNEIARHVHNDGEGKKSGRKPVIGITIKQKDSPDHHIVFSKRQKLVQHKYRKVHHRHFHH